MKKITLCISIFLLVQLANAQITFQKTYEIYTHQEANYVQQTTDFGYIFVGSCHNGITGSSDVYLIKTDVNGDTLWTKTIGGNGEDVGWCIQQTTDSGYIISGNTSSFGAGFWDAYLIKTDMNGNITWSKKWGGSNGEFGYSCQQTTDGNYIVSGFTSSYGAGFTDVYLAKINSNGNLLWSKTYGGINYEEGNSVKQTIDGGYIITGNTQSAGAGNKDVLLLKTDSIGNLLWSKTYGGIHEDGGYHVQQTSDSGYIVVGYYNFAPGYADIYLIKTDMNGDTLWTRTFDEQTNGFDVGFCILQTPDDGYILTGMIDYSEVCLIRTDSNGNALWAKHYGGPYLDNGRCSIQTNDGGYLIAGKYNFPTGPTITGIYLIKTDSLGNSGCNDDTLELVITSALTQVTSSLFTVSSPFISATSTGSFTTTGGNVTDLCLPIGFPNLMTEESSILIFPNPASQKFDITFNKVINLGYINLQNILGENILIENITNESKKEINLKYISSGIYLVKVFDGEKTYCKKLIVEHD